MALKITLKPNEKMIVGGAVITNGSRKTELFIENQVPILRERDVMKEEGANTPCRRIYFAIQLMYIDPPKLAVYQDTYFKLARDLVLAVPSFQSQVEQISHKISSADYYQALRLTQKLIILEQEILQRV